MHFMTKIAKDIIKALQAENIPCTFQKAEDSSVDDEVEITGHPLDLHVQITPYGYPYLYSVGMWTNSKKDTMETYDCKSINEVLSQVKTRLNKGKQKRS